MPKAATKKNGVSSTRQVPYTKSSPKDSDSADKENVAPPSDNVPSVKAKRKSKSQDSFPNKQSHTDYRAIPLDRVKDEVPCYDNAAAVRRKLKNLLSSKDNIPGTSPAKKWSQAGMAAEMQKLEEIDGPVEEMNKNGNGPTARSLAIFLKKSGNMGGADSPCFYWGYVMLEKLRIMKGDKKSKPRMKAEEEYPGGYARQDPKHIRVWATKEDPPSADYWKPHARDRLLHVEKAPSTVFLDPGLLRSALQDH